MTALWSCPDCAFTFDACHTDADGDGYSCPACGELAAEARLEAVKALCEEWEADDREHLNTFGQHLPCSLAIPAERLRAVLSVAS